MKRSIAAVLVSLVAVTAVQADVLVNYDFTGGSASPTTEDPNVVTFDVTDTDGDFGTSSTGNNLFIRSRYATAETEAAAVGSGAYFSVMLEAATGFTLDLTSLDFDAWYQPGADLAVVQPVLVVKSSVDGFTDADMNVGTHAIATAGTSGSPDDAGLAAVSMDLSGAEFQGLSSIEFRIYQYDQTDGNDITRIDNVTVNGAAVPEPATLGVLAFGALAAVRRRRR